MRKNLSALFDALEFSFVDSRSFFGKMKMKKSVMLIVSLAVAALFAQSTFADDTHQHGAGGAAQEQAAKPSEKMGDHESMMQETMKKMHDQVEAIKQAKDPAERMKLLQEHNESMLSAIKMMREMMGGMKMGGGMGGCHMMHGHSASEHGGSADATGASSKPESITGTGKQSEKSGKQLWVCPMHPEVVQDHPGVCPICGMDLVKMEPSGASKSGHSHKMGSKSGHDHKMGSCMTGGGMKDGCKKGQCKKGQCKQHGKCMEGDCMMGGNMMGGMMGMMEEHMDMMLMLMEQMIEHSSAVTAVQK